MSRETLALLVLMVPSVSSDCHPRMVEHSRKEVTAMTMLTISQRQMDEYTVRLGRLEDELRAKDEQLKLAVGLLEESAEMLARYHAATDALDGLAARRLVLL